MATLLFTASILFFLLTLAPMMPFSAIITDLPSHFVLQYVIGGVILLGLVWWFKAGNASSILSILGILLSAWQILPLLPFGTPAEAHGAPLKILQANVLILNKNTVPLQELIERENPDIVVGAEIHEAFAVMFKSLTDEYPYQAIFPSDNNSYGLAVISKLPLNDIERHYFDQPRIPSLSFNIDVNGVKVTMLSVHPATPMVHINSRDNDLAKATQWFADQNPTHGIILGDFNATPYCPAFKKMKDTLELNQARDKRGIMGTYPTFFPAFMRIPIDHVLVTPTIGVINHRLGDEIGSDHMPTITTIAVE